VTEQPLTEESLRQALQEFYNLGDVPESRRKPIRRAYYEERKRHFESTGDQARLEVLKIYFEPVDIWDEEQS
jgi:hypothetical protein